MSDPRPVVLVNASSSGSKQPWVLGVCSVVFDVDVGQTVEHLVPEGILSKEEMTDLAFHSFPVRHLGTPHTSRSAGPLPSL